MDEKITGQSTGEGQREDAVSGAAEWLEAAQEILKKPPTFREVQQFLWWVVIPVAVVTAVIWWTFFKQVVLGEPVGEKAIPDWLAWALALVFGLGLPAFAWVIRLVTEVRPGVLTVRLVPFRTLFIPIEYVGEAFAREYSAAREYGGYGARKGFMGLNIGKAGRSGWAYTARGNKGVQLVLKNGLRILIGSQRSKELLSAIRSAGADAGQKRAPSKKKKTGTTKAGAQAAARRRGAESEREAPAGERPKVGEQTGPEEPGGR